MVSIIMPVYNGEKYIKEAIESIINQTYSNWELLIVDDGSTDNTASIIKEFNDSRIKYMYQKNQGPSAARNKGLDLAEGNYIAFIDADDMYVNEKLEKQVAYLEENSDVDIVYNDIKVIDESTEEHYLLKSEGGYSNGNDFLAMLLFRQIIPAPHTILCRRRCFENGVRYNSYYLHAEDYDLTLRLAKSNKFGHLSGTLYICRRHEKNLTNNHQKQLQSEIQIIKSIGFRNIEKIVMSSSFSNEQRLMLLGKVYLKIEEYRLAKQTFLTLYNTGLRNQVINFYLGNCHFLLKEFGTAKSFYKEALLHKNQRAEIYNNLGCVYGINGELERANSFFNKALALKKGYMDANHNKNQLNKIHPNWKITKRELRDTLIYYK